MYKIKCKKLTIHLVATFDLAADIKKIPSAHHFKFGHIFMNNKPEI
jgi:hypothetical protein